MSNTNKTLPNHVSNKDEDFPKLQQTERDFLGLKISTLSKENISNYATDIFNFVEKEIAIIKNQLSVLHKTDSEISSLLCEVLYMLQEIYEDLASRSTFWEDALHEIEGNSECVARISKQLKAIILQLKQLQDTCVSYDVFKILESRVENIEESINKRIDEINKQLGEKINKVYLESTRQINEKSKELDANTEQKLQEYKLNIQEQIELQEAKIEEYRKETENKLSRELLGLQGKYVASDELETLLKRYLHLESKVSKKSFFDSMWYKVSVGVAALSALAISILGIFQ